MTAEGERPRAAGGSHAGDTLLAGLVAGMVGALTAALWFLVLDLAAGRPLFTPAILGTALIHRTAPVPGVAPAAPVEVLAYTGFHLLLFVSIGLAFAWLLARFGRFPLFGLVLLVLFLGLALGFIALDGALGARLLGHVSPWSVLVATALAATAMSAYLWKRHPRILEGVREIWEDEP